MLEIKHDRAGKIMALRGACNRCGKCCEAIVLPQSLEYIKVFGKHSRSTDYGFAYRNLIPISREEALRINPHLVKWGESLNESFFYRCKQFCEVSRSCIIHDERPHMCSGYPWYYSGVKERDPLYSPDCGYKVDQIIKRWCE